MAYSDQYTVAMDNAFRVRVRMAIIDAAKDVYTEDPGTVGHEIRADLAKEVLRFNDMWISAFAFAIAEEGSTGSATDAEIKTAVSSVWNAIAGV